MVVEPFEGLRWGDQYKSSHQEIWAACSEFHNGTDPHPKTGTFYTSPTFSAKELDPIFSPLRLGGLPRTVPAPLAAFRPGCVGRGMVINARGLENVEVRKATMPTCG